MSGATQKPDNTTISAPAIHATSESRVREEICVTGASLYQRGYTVGSAGNISARLDDGWLITPTDACLGRLDPANIAKVDFDGNAVSGGKPSKTLALHRGIYARNGEARGIVHTHSTHLVALTLAGVWSEHDVLPPITPYYVMKVGHVPLIRYSRPGDPQVAAQIAALADQVRAVLLERLGPVVWERSVAHASYALEELEETARLWLMTNPRPAPLNEAALDELRSVFGARW
ncbi:3-oxo-tetronate 4-phosphate decarboxylase [Paraburkholderia phenoliruptrix]|uniref:3-oxo-tetronate 4-phosphate decarboxylase n=1 Tax=Paraburkholderia phenoliruptrix TaxID=252970 RepID=UPI0034CE6ADA